MIGWIVSIIIFLIVISWIYNSIKEAAEKRRKAELDERSKDWFKDFDYQKEKKEIFELVGGGNLKFAKAKVQNRESHSIPFCAKCNIQLVKRIGKYGLFWGCPNYPNCRTTKDGLF